MTVTPLTPLKRRHEKDIFQVDETLALDSEVTLRIESRELVQSDSFDALVHAAQEVYDSFTDDDPSWRIRSHMFDDDGLTQFVLHKVTRTTPERAETFVAPARSVYRSLVFGDTPDDASFDVNARLEGRGLGGETEEVRVSIPSTGSDSLSPAEARSLAQTLEANATDTAFHTLVNADSAEGVLEAAETLRQAADIIKLREREDLITE